MRKHSDRINLMGFIPVKKAIVADIAPWPVGANIVRVRVAKVFWIKSGKGGDVSVGPGEHLFLRTAFDKSPVYLIPQKRSSLSQRRILELVASGHIVVLGSLSTQDLLKEAGLESLRDDSDDGAWKIEDGKLVYPAPKGKKITLDDSDGDMPWVRVNGRLVYWSKRYD